MSRGIALILDRRVKSGLEGKSALLKAKEIPKTRTYLGYELGRQEVREHQFRKSEKMKESTDVISGLWK